MMRAKNQVSMARARQLALDSKMHWRNWEKAVEMVLTVNSFWVFHMPRMPTKALNKRFKAGLPDFIAIGKVNGPNRGRLLFIEAKTGNAKLTEQQGVILEALLLVPGVSGGVFYPSQRRELVELAGGVEVIR